MVKERGLRAPLSKNSNITDFFKPFARPPSSKRPRDEATTSFIPITDCRRSKSPKLFEVHRPSPRKRGTSDISTSTLTSIASDETIEAPSEACKLPGITEQAPSSFSSSQNTGSSGSTLPSSQRVIKNGEVMIKNSDGESDSDSSLEDPEQLLRGYGNRHKPSPLTDSDLSRRATPAQRVTRSMNASEKSVLKELPALPKYRFSLGTLIAQAEKDGAAEAGVERAIRLAEELDRKRTTLEERMIVDRLSDGINTDALASIIKKEDPDDVDKLLQAIQRTEALQFKKSWHFLDSEIRPSKRLHFPSCHGHLIESLREDTLRRDALFVSGYLGEVAANKALPDDIYEWILDSAPLESRDDFRRAGLAILQESQQDIPSLSDLERIENLFRGLGVSNKALDIEQSIKPILCDPKEEEARPRNWDGLEHTLRVVGCVARWMKSQSRLHTFSILCRAAMDSSILAKAGPLLAMQDAIAALIDSIPSSTFGQESSDMIVRACRQADAQSHTQKLQLLEIFPVFTARLGDFRRRLAVGTLVEDSKYLLKQSTPLAKLSDFTHYLQHEPRFAVRPGTDYSWLIATIAILDTALDDGLRPYEATLDREVEKEFNRQVDELSKVIKDMFTKILDTGASHMTRTEAKEVLEALHARLEYAIRTKPKPKASLFGDMPEAESKTLMKNFLRKSGED